jgi:hypothetical protein
MKQQVLKSSDLQKRFDRDGFVLVDLLNEDKLSELFKVLEGLKQDKKNTKLSIDSGYNLSFFSESDEYRKKVFEVISNFFQPLVDEYLDRYKPLIINTFDKEPGTGEVPVHQNWTFVDEEKYTSVSVWIPLTDVSHANGTLEVVPGSHDVLTPYRSPTIPWVFEGLADVLKAKYMEPLNLHVGQVAILDDALLHYSSVNDTDNVRSTLQLIMKPENAPAIHYYRTDPEADSLEVFEVNKEFFTRFKMNEKPSDVPHVATIPFSYASFSEQELVERVSKNNPSILA